MNRTIFALTIALFTLALCSHAQANNVKEAKKHFKAGTSLIKVEDFEGAVAEFEVSYRLNPHKSALFNLANCYKAIHQYGKALDALEQLLDEHGKQLSAEMRRGTNKTVKELEALVATVQVNVDQPGAKIKFNDEYEAVSPQTQPFIVGPGTHKLEVRLEGFEPHTMDVSVVAREDKTLVISLSPKTNSLTDPAPEPAEDNLEILNMELQDTSRTLSPLSWVGIGGTVVFGVTTGILWGVWSNKYDAYLEADALVAEHKESETDAEELVKAADDAGEQAAKIGNFAIASSVVTGVFLVGTTISLILDLKHKKESPTKHDNNLVFSPGSVTVRF